MFRLAKIQIPNNLLKTTMRWKPENTVLKGKIVNFTVGRELVEKIGDLFGIKPESTSIVYCPYWLLVYKNRRVLIDGLSKKIDVEATREVISLIR
jgi:hypothetical protein